MNSPNRSKRNEADTCPIAATVAILGDRWSVLIMRDLLIGLRRFDELIRSLGIATNILTDRLNRLTDEGLISRHAYQTNPKRYEYAPTDAGKDFHTVILTMGEWGKSWRMAPQGRTPLRYINESTGNAVAVKLVDNETGAEVAPNATQSVTTEWADDLVNWRIQTALTHRDADQSGET